MIVWLNRVFIVVIDVFFDVKWVEGFDGVINDILEYFLLVRSYVGES